MAEHAGKVYLVGSGPGDAAYLTLQAQEILAQAEVLIYDALVDGDLIALVSDACLTIDVGKRGGRPSTPQSEINQLLVEYCQQGKVVVRLKNGDPFIFGRAQSEIGALKRANCEFEVVPGLSSALLAPLLAGIPLTDPRLSPGFTVLTAHNPDILNWVSLAKLDTLVFLMGGRTLPEIVRRLRGHGRSPDTPIAVIRYAGRARQQIWEGTLATIIDMTANQSLSPCVIVVGDVVRLRSYIGEQGMGKRRASHDLQKAAGQHDDATERTPVLPSEETDSLPWQRPDREPAVMPLSGGPLPEPGLPASVEPAEVAEVLSVPHPPAGLPLMLPTEPVPAALPLPLSGKTVLVTRAASQSSQFTALLEAVGATVVEMPTLEIGPPSSWRDLDRAIAHLEDFEWLVLTSANGVDFFFQRLEAVTGERNFSTNIKIAVVGEKTAQRLKQMGIPADFIPPNFVADSLVDNFPEPLSGLRILFPRVESGGREVLVKEFTNQGAKVREVAAYESYCPKAIAPPILVALQAKAIDVITFASSKTVRNFCQLLQEADANWPSWIESACIASIGPQTSKSCESLLGRVDVEATEYTLEGLTQAIVDWFTVEPTPPELEPASSEQTPADGGNDPAFVTPEPLGDGVSPPATTDASDSAPPDAVIDLELIAVEPVAEAMTAEPMPSNGADGYEATPDSVVAQNQSVIDLEIVAESVELEPTPIDGQAPHEAEATAPDAAPLAPDPWELDDEAVLQVSLSDGAEPLIAQELEIVEQLLSEVEASAQEPTQNPVATADQRDRPLSEPMSVDPPTANSPVLERQPLPEEDP